MIIFQHSNKGRRATAQAPLIEHKITDIPAYMLRRDPPQLPEVSELQTVRHYTNLSRKNFSIDTHFYPLGSCTMKYNPRGAHKAAMLPEFLSRHPLTPESYNQGLMSIVYELQQMLMDITGMKAISLAPMAGAQGEFSGVAMIAAYHKARNDTARTEILIPSAAHGTNPATAAQCGFKVKEIPVTAQGDINIDALKNALGPQTAGLMMTNPSTCGVFDRKIEEIAQVVHQAGGLLYYDGANLNAILGKVKPGEMGFDVMHLNLHKTFATPHGGGGPGSGPVAVGERLEPFLPIPYVVQMKSATGHVVYRWYDENDKPQTIGRLSAFMGNMGILLRAYAYARMLGHQGLRRVGQFATLNANYLAKKLEQAGFELAYPERYATHEVIITLKQQAKQGTTAMDFAKRLLDYGYHAPTTYFPLLIPECFLIEPTETETKDEIDGFVAALTQIKQEAQQQPELLKQAPHTMPVARLDDVRAARQLDLTWPEGDQGNTSL